MMMTLFQNISLAFLHLDFPLEGLADINVDILHLVDLILVDLHHDLSVILKLKCQTSDDSVLKCETLLFSWFYITGN